MDGVTLHQGDCLALLPQVAAGSVDCPDCDGYGDVPCNSYSDGCPNSSGVDCDRCGGTGRIATAQPPLLPEDVA